MYHLLLLLFLFTSAVAHADTAEIESQKCSEIPGKKLWINETLFAYSIEGKLAALAIFNGKEFLPADGQEFKHITIMYDLLDQKTYSVSFDAYFTRLGEDRCIWFARLIKEKPRSISIFASTRIKLVSEISTKVMNLFYSINTTCVDQGDYPPDKKPPCTKPKLLSTSDLNSNGRIEFWHTTPYTWDTGFTISELTESGKYLEIISSKCLDCD